MNTQAKTLASSDVKDRIPHEVPTSNQQEKMAWKIGSSSLSCGLRELQGWSDGVGIFANGADFEKKLALLIYWSKDQSGRNKYPVEPGTFKGQVWNYSQADGTQWSPIGIPRQLFQFLHSGQNYLHSGETAWINRFEKFVKDNDLGTYMQTGGMKNPNYRTSRGEDAIRVAVWTWNGNVPDMSKWY